MSKPIFKTLSETWWDNVVCHITWMAIVLFGVFGTVGALNSMEDNYPVRFEARRPPRMRRREMLEADSNSNGIKKNALATAR